MLEALQACKIQSFAGLKLEKRSNTVFEIVQIFNSHDYSMTKTTIENNAKKYEMYTNYNNSTIYREVASIINPPSEPEEYTEQDYIDDAFGGEASAYWNID